MLVSYRTLAAKFWVSLRTRGCGPQEQKDRQHRSTAHTTANPSNREYWSTSFSIFSLRLELGRRAGGFRQYEAQVTKSLAAIFEPKFPKLPAEVIPTIVAFWAHVGDY